mmetsp:Transcript_73368/g.148456  ORF Transcript_73368/g.148456 Transcript_73368/m.148456 type:complete len:229 (-) Transcript_73368:192-878(-)
MDSIDHSEDAIDLAVLVDHRVQVKGLAHGSRVCHAGGLDQNAVQGRIWDSACQSILHRVNDITDRQHQVITEGAAKATVVQDGYGLHRGLLASTLLQKHLIDSGIAELVFDHCVLLPMLRAKNVIQQSCLPSTQETCQHGHRDPSLCQNTFSLANAVICIQWRIDGHPHVQFHLIWHCLLFRPARLVVSQLHDGTRLEAIHIALHPVAHFEPQICLTHDATGSVSASA